MKVVILAGGKGTRISEESIYRPKPMIEIGGYPIIWHIMKSYAYYGHSEFIVCAGYKQEYIKDWFNNYFIHNSDITYDYTEGNSNIMIHKTNIEPWKVTIVDTGLDTMTGGRIKRIERYVKDEPFLMTYGDGVCDVNINDLIDYHKGHGKKATLTAVVQKQEKGVLDISEIGEVRNFREKDSSDEKPINAGYMVLEPSIFEYLDDDTTVFERKPLEILAAEGELMSYRHEGFWQCMDSLREKELLEVMWKRDKAKWKVWN